MKYTFNKMNNNLHKDTFNLIASILASCVTNKDLTYLQYKGTPPDTVVAVTPATYKVLPYDNLFIRVVTPDPQWSAMFNTIPTTAYSVTVTEQSADLISYPVDSSGAILLPYLGKIQVAGKNLATIIDDVQVALRSYIADAAVSVKLINNYVSLLGEVNRPGRYPIYKDRLNIFQALAMGSDLGDYSNRQVVQVIRQTIGGNLVKEFSLTNRSIMSSEFFYVMPNDVIYAKPIKGKFFQMNAFPYGVIISTITMFVLIYSVVQ